MVKILKSDRTVSSGDLPDAFNAEDLREQARIELEKAHAKAALILEAANVKAADLYRATKDQALSDAQQEFDSAVADRAEKLIQIQGQQLREKCESLLNGLQQETHAWLEGWSQATVRVSRAFAEKILRRELSVDSAAQLETWITEAAQQVRENRQLTLHLHPKDEAIGDSLLDTLSKTQPIFSSVSIRTDPSIEPGGFRVTSAMGSIDCQLGVQLERIEAQLLGQSPAEKDSLP
jgi:flagellar biosynthesis/type III secretory pathway protein FliH